PRGKRASWCCLGEMDRQRPCVAQTHCSPRNGPRRGLRCVSGARHQPLRPCTTVLVPRERAASHESASPMTLRAYVPARDEAVVYGLWQDPLGHGWPLSRTSFHHVTTASGAYEPGDHLVAEAGGLTVGFVGTQTRTVPDALSPRGELMVLMVAPRSQRRGI